MYRSALLLRRGGIVNRTCSTHKNLYIYIILLTICCLIYYGPSPVKKEVKHAQNNFVRWQHSWNYHAAPGFRFLYKTNYYGKACSRFQELLSEPK